VAQQVFESGAEGRLEYVIKGETNLMGMAELTRHGEAAAAVSKRSTKSATFCTCSTRA